VLIKTILLNLDYIELDFLDLICQSEVAPVGFDFDGEYFYVGGINILKSTKYKNVLKNNKVALVIDDLRSIDP
jgi:pyridoxamine 5'-phosphate oxidase family protein